MKRLASMFLALCMALTLLPAQVFADKEADIKPLAVAEVSMEEEEETAPQEDAEDVKLGDTEPVELRENVEKAESLDGRVGDNVPLNATASLMAADEVASGTCGLDVTWTLDSAGLMTISGSGEIAGHTNSYIPINELEDYVPWYSRRSEIKLVEITSGVTSIGSNAFSGCTNLTSVTIPDSVTSIGDGAFYDCKNLTSVKIPDGVTSIGDYAFFKCTGLTSVTIPDSVTSIGDYAFFGCTGLTSVTISDSATSIGNYAFYGCTGLTSATIPDSATSIGDCAFQNCAGLTSVTIGSGVTRIGESAFNSCWKLTSVTIPDGVVSIGDYAFANCSLQSVTIPDSVTSMGVHVFQTPTNQTTLTEIIGGAGFFSGECGNDGENVTWSLVNGVLTISGSGGIMDCNSEYDFGGNLYSDMPWLDYRKSVKTLVIENGITSMGSGAFTDFSNLSSILLPDSMTNIGYNAFYGCEGLTSVTIPNSVTSIGNWAFFRCKSLTSISIPDSVTSIEEGAFESCIGLTCVIIPDSVTSIGKWAFFNCTSLADVYYSGTEEAWNAITIGDSNARLINATIHYNSTGPGTGGDVDTYTVIWLDGDGSELDRKTYVEGEEEPTTDKTPTKAADERYTYTFDAWDDGSVEGTTKTYHPVFTEIPVGGESGTGGIENAVTLTAKDTVTGKTVPQARLTVTDSGGSAAEYTTASDGTAAFSGENGTYQVRASAEGYQDRAFTVTVTDEKRAFTVYLNADDVLQVETTTKELTREEAVQKGIDVDAPENRHIYESTAVFTFGELRYISNDTAVLQGEPLVAGNITAYPVARDIYLIVYSRVNWLKELFQIELLAQNTSSFERIENCAAHLDLPEGLSLAVMTEGAAAQTADVSLGTIAPHEEKAHFWYLCGDEKGEYTLTGAVTGTRSNEDGSVREDVSADFTTSEPIEVLAGDAMTLTIAAEKYGTIGQPYSVKYTLKNVSEKTLYDVSLTVMGGKFVEDYDVSDLEYDSDNEELTGSLEEGFYLSDETFEPGEALTGVFTITFGKGLDIAEGMEYILKEMFSLTSERSATEIPTFFEWIENGPPENLRVRVTFDGGNGAGTMDEKPLEAEDGAESVLYTLPECGFTPPEGQKFKAWLVDGEEYAPGDECELTADTTVTAVWTAAESGESGGTGGTEEQTCTVTWAIEDGTVLETDKAVPYGTTPAYDGKTPEKEADAQYTYTFSGWMPEVVPASGDVMYTAAFTRTLNAYTVTWADEDGTVLKTDKAVPYGTIPAYDGETPTKAADAQYTYTFSGWNPEVVSVSGDVTYTAVFTQTLITYTVTWTDADGKILKTDKAVPYGTTPTYDGKTPVKAADTQYAYTFSGWKPEVVPVSGNVTYTAEFTQTLNAYTVTWTDADGTVLETDKAVPYGTIPTYDGTTPAQSQDAQQSYQFAGWTPEVGPVNGDAVYKASYGTELNRYTITWADADGKVLETDKAVPYGTTPTYDGKKPEKAADAQYTYTFSGWTPKVVPASGSVTYTAAFTQTLKTYTVTWADADGKVLKTDKAVPYGTTPAYDGKTPTRAADAQYAYTFSGWTPEIKPVSGDAAYTAVFTQTLKTYTVTWADADGKVLKTDKAVPYGTTPAYDGKTPTKAADAQYTYTFSGWMPEVVPVSSDVKYTAAYTQTLNAYTVTWTDADGKVLETDKAVPYGTTPTYDGKTPTKAADAQYTYTFSGWTPEVVPVSGNVSYAAEFRKEPRLCTVIWLDAGGKELDRKTYPSGSAEPATTAKPVKASDNRFRYDFTGWTVVSDNGSEKTYAPQFDAVPLPGTFRTVIWLNGDGSELDRKTYPVGEAEPTTDRVPTKSAASGFAFVFALWEVSSDNGTEKTYSPLYDAIPLAGTTHTIIWLDGDGLELDQKTYQAGEMEPKTDCTPVKKAEGTYLYTFTGWDRGTVQGSSKIYTPQFASTNTAEPSTENPVTPDTGEPGTEKPNTGEPGTEKPVTEYTVKFNSQGGSAVASERVSAGNPVQQPQDPVKSGYYLRGWYREAACKTLWDFTQPVTKDMTLYAGWSANSGGSTGKTGCYVATAVYGSYDCPEVWTLRRFRDEALAKTWHGRVFIKLYYTVSPTAVKLFGNTAWFRNFFRNRLDPMVNSLWKRGVASSPYHDRTW